jgi:hypothetical protein
MSDLKLDLDAYTKTILDTHWKELNQRGLINLKEGSQKTGWKGLNRLEMQELWLFSKVNRISKDRFFDIIREVEDYLRRKNT